MQSRYSLRTWGQRQRAGRPQTLISQPYELRRNATSCDTRWWLMFAKCVAVLQQLIRGTSRSFLRDGPTMHALESTSGLGLRQVENMRAASSGRFLFRDE